MLGTINALALLTLCCTTLFAQRQQADPSVEIAALSKQRAALAKEWLQSTDPLHIAWGAALTRQESLRDLAPLLVAQAQEYSAADSIDGSYVVPADRDRHDAMLAVLDTLICLDLLLPAQTSGKLYGEFPTQALILLVRSGDEAKPAVLLNIFQHSRYDSPWLVAGNVLSHGYVFPPFAAGLMRSFTKHLSVTVTDRNGGLGRGGSSGCNGDVGYGLKANWPAVGAYALRHGYGLQSGVTLLADGDEPVYYLRYESKSYGGLSGPCDNGDDRDTYRAEYLARMAILAGVRAPLRADRAKDVDPHPSLGIQWTNAEDYQREVLAAIVRQRDATFRVIQRLHELHWLTDEDAASLQPHIEVTVWDQRQNKSVALPVVMPNDDNTRFISQSSPPQR